MASQNNSASDAAAMVAVKTEYNADTDDEAVSAADRNSALHTASMVAVKTEYNADTDSDEEQQQSIKKAKRDDNEANAVIPNSKGICKALHCQKFKQEKCNGYCIACFKKFGADTCRDTPTV